MSRPSTPEAPLGLLSVPQAARFLEFAEGYVRRLADTGVIPSVRDHANRRLFKGADLEKFVTMRAVKTVGGAGAK